MYDLASGNDANGVPVNADAAFADYSVNVGFTYLFGGNKAEHAMENAPKFNDVKN